MTIPSTLESLSATIGSNVPAEGDGTLMTSVNDGLRAAYGFIRQAVSSGSDIASASTITPPSNGSSFNITGTTTITAIASTNSWDGRTICLRFEGAIGLTHSSSLVLPASANITAASGDYALFRQYSSGIWHCVSYLPFSGIPLVKGSTSAKFIRGDGVASDTLVGPLTLTNTTGSPLTITSNTSADVYATYTNASASGATGYRITNTGGVDGQFSANANSGLLVGSITNHPVDFLVNSSAVGRWTTAGALLIGTTAAVTNEYFLVKRGGTGTVSQIIWQTATTGDNNFISFGTEASFTSRGSISYNRAGGLVAYNTTSDYRAKDVLGPVNDSGSVIDSLKIHMGRMKGASIARPMLVAHEAKAVAPYSVTGEKDEVDVFGKPRLQQIDHSSFIPLILAELQDIRKRLTILEDSGGSTIVKPPSPSPAPPVI